jgi:phosphate transport system protein
MSSFPVARSTAEHISRDFETELRELRAQLLAMGARCERVVGVAFDAFLRGSTDLVADVDALDAQIDRDEIEINALILRILALRQPVADDLRFLTTALRLITDLERIGDEAVNVGERTVRDGGAAPSLVGDDLRAMSVAALDMLHLALDAFVRWDDAQAQEVLGRDEQVDRLCASIISKMTAHMSRDASDMQGGLRVVRVAKYLERIGDHATNVAEAVIFMVRGEDVRHRRFCGSADPDPASGGSPGPEPASVVPLVGGVRARRRA